MKKPDLKFWGFTALFLVLCLLAQFLEPVSVYLSESLVNALLVMATLVCGYLSGLIVALAAPLLSWLATGSEVLSAMPWLLPCLMLGNLLFISLIWVFAKWLEQRLPKAERLPFADARFRLGLIVSAVAAVLWVSVILALLSSLSDFLEGATPVLLITALVGAVGSFLLFACLWMLVSRFPRLWPFLTGAVLASAVKALVLRYLVVQTVLPRAAAGSGLSQTLLEQAAADYSSPQLIAALLGSALALALWLLLRKHLSKPTE